MTSTQRTTLFGTGFVTLALAVGAGSMSALAPAQQAKPAAKEAAPQPASATESDDETTIKLADAPEAVRAAVAKVTPADKVTKVVKESDDGITLYEVEFKADGMDASASFSGTGELIELEKSVKESALPAAAAASLKKHYPNATFGGHVAVQKFYYEVAVTIDGKKHEVKVDALGEIQDSSKKHEESDKD